MINSGETKIKILIILYASICIIGRKKKDFTLGAYQKFFADCISVYISHLHCITITLFTEKNGF